MTGRFDMGGKRITGFHGPISNKDAATRNYVNVLISSVDDAVQSVDNKASLRRQKL